MFIGDDSTSMGLHFGTSQTNKRNEVWTDPNFVYESGGTVRGTASSSFNFGAPFRTRSIFETYILNGRSSEWMKRPLYHKSHTIHVLYKWRGFGSYVLSTSNPHFLFTAEIRFFIARNMDLTRAPEVTFVFHKSFCMHYVIGVQIAKDNPDVWLLITLRSYSSYSPLYTLWRQCQNESYKGPKNAPRGVELCPKRVYPIVWAGLKGQFAPKFFIHGAWVTREHFLNKLKSIFLLENWWSGNLFFYLQVIFAKNAALFTKTHDLHDLTQLYKNNCIFQSNGLFEKIEPFDTFCEAS